MNYQWIYYNLTTGELVSQSSTHPPLDQTQQFDQSLIPPGHSVIGPYDDGDSNSAPMDFLLAFNNSSAWLYVDNKFVKNPSYNPVEVKLRKEKALQIANIKQGYKATLEGGFISNVTGKGDTYSIDDSTYPKWMGFLSVLNSRVGPTEIDVKKIDGQRVTLNLEQFHQFVLDGFNFLLSQEQQLWKLEDQVNNQTATPSVPVVWTCGNYIPEPASKDEH